MQTPLTSATVLRLNRGDLEEVTVSYDQVRDFLNEFNRLRMREVVKNGHAPDVCLLPKEYDIYPQAIHHFALIANQTFPLHADRLFGIPFFFSRAVSQIAFGYSNEHAA